MQKPDFTGTWTFNQEKSKLQIPAPDATVFVVDHREPALRISRTHFAGDNQDKFSLDLTTDGQEVSVDRADVRLRCRAHWEGDTLVFDTQLVHAAGEATNVVRYALSSDGMILVAEERFRSGSLNYDNVWVLDHRSRAFVEDVMTQEQDGPLPRLLVAAHRIELDVARGRGVHMASGQRRTMAARGAAALGFLCGVFGLLAGVTEHVWKFGATGWFAGGALLTLLALFALVDGALAAQRR